jgi:hypothetical protein
LEDEMDKDPEYRDLLQNIIRERDLTIIDLTRMAQEREGKLTSDLASQQRVLLVFIALLVASLISIAVLALYIVS